MYTFTLGWINYLSHSILQLKGEYLIAGKQMALPFWVCLTRTKKLIGLQPYSHRLRTCQIPSGREIWIWWLVSNRIFQGQKRKQLVCRLFVCFKVTSTYHRSKIKKNLTLPLPLINWSKSALSLSLQLFFFQLKNSQQKWIIVIDKYFTGNIRNQQSQ